MAIRQSCAALFIGMLALAGCAERAEQTSIAPESAGSAAPASGGAIVASQPADHSEIPDFTFLQISDIHIEPHLTRTGPPGKLRGAECIEWICAEAGKPQQLTPFNMTVPPPSFVIATGDLTEYGVVDDTWDIFEKAFEKLPCPLYVVPGNHDNTWVAMYHIMRKRHGGENYSFDKFGCHFVGISSASPQEPVPTFDGKTRAWLKKDLDSISPGTPVFVFFHHPPYSEEFALAEKDTFIDLLKDYNVVLLLYGHGHGVEHRNIDGIDGVMGGSTFASPNVDNSGYNIISVKDGVARIAYRYFSGKARTSSPTQLPMRRLMEKKASRPAQPGWRGFEIVTPDDRQSLPPEALMVGLGGFIWWPDWTGDLEIDFQIDGRGVMPAKRTLSKPIRGGDNGERFHLPVSDLTPGAHVVSVNVTGPTGFVDRRARVFSVGQEHTGELWRASLPAAIKSGPVLSSNSLVIARNDGIIAAFDRTSGSARWGFAVTGEVLGTPACYGARLLFGSGDGRVQAIDIDGKPQWTFETTQPVYGAPLIEGDTVFIGDNGGRMHALDLATGKPRWTFERADYSIECKPCLWNDLLVFGAWDGYVYALNRGDGSVKWKSLGPSSSVEKAARYYSPADCGPIAISERLYVCDRGYRLGVYDREGKLAATIGTDVSAIGLSEDGQSFYTRGTKDRVGKRDSAGEIVWEMDVPAGRFPIPPTERGGKLYLCSNIGLLSVLDARDGKLLWQYQVTPGFYVMAPVTVDEDGTCFVAGMDGSLTAVRHRD
ncbi:MAG TPA: PQQ-binding-like beta-propeller repeat protein [Phycisphaerae bacterium]